MHRHSLASRIRPPVARSRETRADHRSFRLLLGILFGMIGTDAHAQLSSVVGGNVQQFPTQCTCACPPGPNGCPNYCDRKLTSQCAEASGPVGSVGSVVGIACSEYGTLRARAAVQPTGTSHLDFGASATFSDSITLQGGSGSAMVRVTIQTAGVKSGTVSDAQAVVSIGSAQMNLSPLPALNFTTLQSIVTFGVPFSFTGVLAVKVGGGAFCPAAVLGDADFYSGNFGVRILSFEVLDASGTTPLVSAAAVGTSGTLYHGCPVVNAQPAGVTMCGNGTATLSLKASPVFDALQYQWRKSGTALTNGPTGSGSTVYGAQTPTLSVAQISALDVGNYDCVVTNACSNVTSSTATITLDPSCLVFCAGDGSGASCPCANTGSPGRGCANSSNGQGAVLTASGNAGASNATDTLVLAATGIPGSGLFFQANGVAPGPLPFGDGLLCATGGIVRLGVVTPTGDTAAYPGGLTPSPVHIAGGVSSGATRHYQCWYRDAVTYCTSATFNVTQGLTIHWGP
jgi:hypothetical protein